MTEPVSISFFATPPHPCNYIEGREAVTVFADPRASMSKALYSSLIQFGYRRSGSHVYTQHCPSCDSCRSLRVRVAEFTPNRAQRRNWQCNQDLEIAVVPAHFSQEHYDLYRRYITQRHAGGGMDDMDADQYREFLIAPWCDTHFVEFRQQGRLLSVAVVDWVESGLSAVYTFFDPEQAKRGLGTYAVLWQIEKARQQGLPYVYLGYWIEESEKMAYKAGFHPHEIFIHRQWLKKD
jgi:arginyl-tRNA--protein-N-Asp/Glu arginylyltransferase